MTYDVENSEQQQEHKSGEAVLRNIKAWNLELWFYSKWYYCICEYSYFHIWKIIQWKLGCVCVVSFLGYVQDGMRGGLNLVRTGVLGSLECGPLVPGVSGAFLGQAWLWRADGSEWERTVLPSHSEGSQGCAMQSGDRKYRSRFIVPSTELSWGLGQRGRPTSRAISEITVRLRLGYIGEY